MRDQLTGVRRNQEVGMYKHGMLVELSEGIAAAYGVSSTTNGCVFMTVISIDGPNMKIRTTSRNILSL